MTTRAPRSRTLARLLPAAALLLVLGCGGDDDRPAARRLDAQRLQSLPYAAGSHATADEPDGVLVHDPERTCPGYNLTTVYALGTAELFDVNGDRVRSWSAPDETWMFSKLLPDGDLLVVGAGTPVAEPGQAAFLDDATRFVRRYDREGNVAWEKPYPAHHDIDVAPDDHLLLLGLEYRVVPQYDPRTPLRDDLLVVLTSDGEPVASQSLIAAVGRNKAALPLIRIPPTTEGGREFIDLLHANSAEWMFPGDLEGTHPLYDPDHILVCLRHQNRVAVVNWPEQRVVWSWGEDELQGPHDARMLDDGNILVFDNGLGEKRSRVVEMDPRSGEIVWQWQADPPQSFFTVSKGSAQRLPNGDTLAVASDSGRAVEVTREGEIVWEWVCPYFVSEGQRAAIVQMERLPLDYVDVAD